MKLYPLYSNQLLLTSDSPTFAGMTLTGNLIIPDAGYIGSVSDTTALQIEADGDILLSSQLGIGITPGAQIEISKDAANATLIISCYHDTEATTPLLTLRKADGTVASPALIDDGAVLGTIHFDGYDGSGWHTGAKIEARIGGGDPSDGTDMPTEIAIWTCPDGSATLAERVVILSNGYAGFNELAPIARVEIEETGAAPNLGTDTGIFALTSENPGNQLQFGNNVASPFGSWLQTKQPNSAGSSFPLLFNPLGGNVGIATQTPEGTLSIGDITEGGTAGLNIQTAHETHTLTLGASSVTTGLDIPTTALVLGAAFCVNTAVTDSTGDDTWSAAFSGGDASAIVAAVAPAQNTKAHSTVVPALTNAETEITFTPQGGNFTAGVIEVVAWYIDLTDLANV